MSSGKWEGNPSECKDTPQRSEEIHVSPIRRGDILEKQRRISEMLRTRRSGGHFTLGGEPLEKPGTSPNTAASID